LRGDLTVISDHERAANIAAAEAGAAEVDEVERIYNRAGNVRRNGVAAEARADVKACPRGRSCARSRCRRGNRAGLAEAIRRTDPNNMLRKIRRPDLPVDGVDAGGGTKPGVTVFAAKRDVACEAIFEARAYGVSARRLCRLLRREQSRAAHGSN
jgi:hypothetical protein